MSKSKSTAAAHAAPPRDALAPAVEEEEVVDDDAGAPVEEAVLEDEFEVEAEAEPAGIELDIDADSLAPPPKEKASDEGSGDSMLARYFREMATHNVMGPDEELETAIEVEQAEVDHWVAILAYLPAAGFALD
jgi:RNA polymerase primary sigma factor